MDDELNTKHISSATLEELVEIRKKFENNRTCDEYQLLTHLIYMKTYRASTRMIQRMLKGYDTDE